MTESDLHNTGRDDFSRMDRMYRYQRYFYDATRKFYLIGRDRLISEMHIGTGENVLEAGCGTARNLIIAAGKYPEAHFYGLDASAEMLKTARSNVEAAGLGNIELVTALADEFSYESDFGLDSPFDAIFFSYALSIIPAWKESILNALSNLKQGGTLHIVDFYDQRDLPRWFKRLLEVWLRQFHVKYPEDLIPFLKSLEEQGLGKLTVDSIFRRYSFIARFEKH